MANTDSNTGGTMKQGRMVEEVLFSLFFGYTAWLVGPYFLNQGLNLCLLHWQANSLPLSLPPCFNNMEKSKSLSLVFPQGSWIYWKCYLGTALVPQWVGICLPMQGTQGLSLIQGNSMCWGATTSVGHNDWDHMLQPVKFMRLAPVPWTEKSHQNEKPVHCS